ncbi:Os02g0147900 [Oryza sativa Japonica Group]|uniref:Uncharacterized protein n=2 Tax=Oryza sativa subsp. japonica TaxID=39947 RepID=A3A349_ORYSJ|nr:hypothetical protein OsJ_05374 [Oryza sativa Japonica Group]BAD13054.1 hypothetical protein [Oryza sativa Japonica Group]BAS76980.1 Os02g0147900 [Oryza sativa Japonica Group]
MSTAATSIGFERDGLICPTNEEGTVVAPEIGEASLSWRARRGDRRWRRLELKAGWREGGTSARREKGEVALVLSCHHRLRLDPMSPRTVWASSVAPLSASSSAASGPNEEAVMPPLLCLVFAT